MTERPTHVRYYALTWLTLAAALSYLCRNAVGVAESTIREDLGLTLEQSGWFMGAFFWTYALFQVPSGWFAERYGTRIALSGFALGWSIASLGIGIAPGFWLLIVAQLIMGIAQAGIFPASCNSVGHWMPLARRSLACGILAAGMQVGAIVASGLTGMLLMAIEWRWVFVAFSLPGIVWAFCFFHRFRDDPAATETVNADELALIRAERADSAPLSPAPLSPAPLSPAPLSPAPLSPAPLLRREPAEEESLLSIAQRPSMWFLCGQQVCRAAGYMFFASWFPTFLQQTRGVSIAESGYQQGLVLAGTLGGSILGGLLVDRIWRRTGSLRLSRSGVGAAALGTCGLLILAAWFVQSVSLAVSLLALGAMFAALAGPCAFAATIDIGGARVPQAFGLMNMCGNLAAAACPVLVGILFQWTANWNLVLLLFAGIYLTGALCWVLVNPSRRAAADES